MITVGQVSQLQPVPERVTEELRAELHRTSIPWRPAYRDYQSGGWSTAPLLNSSGRASNLGDQARVHLILDCFINSKLTEMLRAEYLDSDAVIRLPVLERNREELVVERARSLFREGQERGDEPSQRDAEHQLLGLFHTFDLQGRSSYEILLRMFDGLDGTEERMGHWRKRLRDVRPVARRAG